MSGWTPELNDAAWLLGYGGWLIGDGEGIVETHGAFIALLQAQAEHRQREWAALERALPHLSHDGGELTIDPPDDLLLDVARAVHALGWWGNAPGATFGDDGCHT